MIANYDDLFLRQSLAQSSPVHYGGTGSPDVLPAGTSPVPDPTKVFAETYDQDIGQPLEAGRRNYIYVRTKNAGEEQRLARLFGCAASATFLAWPDQLAPLVTEDGRPYFEISVGPAKVGVSTGAFVYDARSSGDVIAAYAHTREHPVQLPTLSSVLDLKDFLHETPAFAQRSVAFGFVDSGPYTYVGTFEQRGVEATMLFSIRCLHCVGWSVGLLPQTDETTVVIPITPITGPNQGVSVEVLLDSGFETTLEFVVDSRGAQVPHDASVRLGIYVVADESSDLPAPDAAGLIPLSGHEWRPRPAAAG